MSGQCKKIGRFNHLEQMIRGSYCFSCQPMRYSVFLDSRVRYGNGCGVVVG